MADLGTRKEPPEDTAAAATSSANAPAPSGPTAPSGTPGPVDSPAEGSAPADSPAEGSAPADIDSSGRRATSAESAVGSAAESAAGSGTDSAAGSGTGSAAVPGTAAEPARATPRAVLLALAALLLVLVIAAGWLGVHVYRAHAAARDRSLALQTAREVATTLTTITSDNFAGQIDALTKVSTQSFKEQMTGYSAMFQALLKQNNVALRGTITGAGVEKVDGDSAAALITVSTLVTSGQQPQGQPQSFGLLVSLQREGDHWLASNVDFLR